MKKTLLFIGLAVAATASFLISNDSANSYSSTPPVAKTGGAGEGTCNGCHVGTDNSGAGSLVVSVQGLDTVQQDSTYTVNVHIAGDASRNKYGFELIARDSSDASVGTFTITDSDDSQILTSNNDSYVSHKNATADTTWTFKWQAPSDYKGQVTFYAAGVASTSKSSNNHSTYTTSTSVYVNGDTNVSIAEESMIQATTKVFPTVSNGTFHINVSGLSSNDFMYTIYDLSGKVIDQKSFNQATGDHTEIVSGMHTGIYLIQTVVDGKESMTKVIVE